MQTIVSTLKCLALACGLQKEVILIHQDGMPTCSRCGCTMIRTNVHVEDYANAA